MSFSEAMSALNDYWSQLLVVIGGVGFAVRYYIERRTKRKDLLFDNKMKEYKEVIFIFNNAYYNALSELRDFFYQCMYTGPITTQVLDERLYPKQRALSVAYYNLQFVIDKVSLKDFTTIYESLQQMQR